MAAEGRNQRFVPQTQLRPRVKVLLVEEDLEELNFYGELLRALGCYVVACASHEEAVLCLQEASFDFIMVSQGSYAFEGRCVLERAIELNRRTPVLVLTRCLSMNCYLEAMQLGAFDYLEKPVAPEQIAWVLETHLRQSNGAA